MAIEQSRAPGALLPADPAFVGPYRLVGRLGQGGMGTVYLAEAPGGRPVAVKVVRRDLAADPEFRQRFRSEVQRARQVPPFCTAEVLDADFEQATPYLVVEYVDGPDLAQTVGSGGPLSAANLHGLAIGVATALAAIHAAGVIHRDLKPRNVLLAPGSPKVIDFGIARAVDATSRLTQPHQLLGTVAYMAPERFDTGSGSSVQPAADIFSWGAVVAFAGTGREPFSAESAVATAGRILTQPPDLDGLPPSLLGLVSAALAKDPAARPTARELLDALLAIQSSATNATTVLHRQPLLRDAVEMATGNHVPARNTGRRRRLVLLAVAALSAAVPVAVATAWAVQQPASLFGGTDAPRGAVDAPAGSSATDGPPARAPATVSGDWIGELQQSFGASEPIHLNLTPDGAGGTVSYPRLGCRGTVVVRQRTGDRVALDERITAGTCTSRGRITLWPTGPSTMLLDYEPRSGAYTARASMTRR